MRLAAPMCSVRQTSARSRQHRCCSGEPIERALSEPGRQYGRQLLTLGAAQRTIMPARPAAIKSLSCFNRNGPITRASEYPSERSACRTSVTDAQCPERANSNARSRGLVFGLTTAPFLCTFQTGWTLRRRSINAETTGLVAGYLVRNGTEALHALGQKANPRRNPGCPASI